MCKTSLRTLLFVALIAVAGQSAAGCKKAQEAEASPPKPAPTGFFYSPPNRGAPAQRVGGGTRSITQLKVLAPSHPGMTTQAQPRLYWYQNPGFRNKIRFRLAEVGVTPPLLEVLLPPAPDGGIQQLDLDKHDVVLEPGLIYEWGVLLEPFPHQRLPPLLSATRIVVNDSARQIISAEPAQRPYLAASQGYWYDAVDWVSRLIEETGGDAGWRLQRAELLDQGGLKSIALYEREMVRYQQ
jgi:hypothetical protein